MKSRDSHKAVVRRTRKYGRGVFARQRIRKGEIIAVFDGPLIDDDFEPWTDDLFQHAIQVGPREWRDSKGIARLINHSCDPNCGIKDLVKIVAMRTIEPGEQITWDYEMTEKNPWFRMRCRCGSPICRRVIGDFRRMPKAIRRKYGNFISEWLQPQSRRPRRRGNHATTRARL